MRARKVLRWLIFLCLVVLLLVGGFYLIANLRGKAAWERAQARLAEEGEVFTLQELYPARIPDAENFFATPALDGIASEQAGVEQRDRMDGIDLVEFGRKGGKGRWFPISYRGASFGIAMDFDRWITWVSIDDTLAVPKGSGATVEERFGAAIDAKYGELLEELSVAGQRAKAQILPPLVERTDFDQPFAADMAHYGLLVDLARTVQLRGIVAARRNELESFTSHLNILSKLAEGYRGEPTSVSQAGADVIMTYATELVWEAINHGGLDSVSLESIEDSFGDPDLRGVCLVWMRWEHIRTQHAITHFQNNWERWRFLPVDEWFRSDIGRLANKAAPAGWWNRNRQVASNWYLNDLIIPARDGTWSEILRSARNLDMILENHVEGKNPHKVVAATVIHRDWEFELDSFPSVEAHHTIVLAACALERHRLRAGEYPDSLADLVAGREDLAFQDPFAAPGISLRYRREGGRYRLWSIGRDGKDDDGVLDKDLIWRFGGVLPPEPPVEPWTPRPRRKKRR